MKKEVFRMERVTYIEHEVAKLEDFNLNVFEGEVLGFIPVNSYGMQGFLSLLRDNLSLYDGYVYYNEILVNSWKGILQPNNKITVIQNESSLVEKLTVADNIFVLRQNYRGEYIRAKFLQKQLEPFLEEIEMNIKADTYVSKLSAFERIVVELIKGVIAGHKLIVMNELETLLTANEVAKLHRMIRYYISKGYSFIYICSHFEDCINISNRAALLLNGRIEKVLQPHEMQIESMFEVFRDYATMVRGHLENKKEYKRSQEVVCEMNFKFHNSKAPFRFGIHNAECLVIQCLDNEMYVELRNSIIENDMNAESSIRVCDRKVRLHQNPDIAIIQEFPTKTMLFPDLNYMDNLCLNLGSRMRGVWFRKNIMQSIRMEYRDMIDSDVFDMQIADLTEKERYQLVYTRILLQKPKVVFCVQPFQGADLDHRMYIWTLLENLLKKGIGVVILAVNLADTLSIADRFIRIDDRNQQYEFVSDEFASMPSLVPWQFLYEEQKCEQ